jgi:dTDP-4-amino-4,6-dideoxygalactose transaminase
MINYGRHFIDEQDINSIKKVLKSNFLTTGPATILFERKVKNYLKTKNFISCSSGTAALDLVFKVLNLGSKSNVIIPSINFIASYNLLRDKNVNIFLSDVDPKHGQMTKKTILECIKINNLKKIDALIPMYHGGYTGFYKDYLDLKKKYKFFIIEDACHAFGANYRINNKISGKIGDCKYSDFSTFSFHPVKTITTAEGGGVSFKSKKYDKEFKLIRSHGIKRTKKHWEYDVVKFGMNYRMSDLNAALGISQLNKVNKYIKYRRQIAINYLNKLKIYNNFYDLNFNTINQNSHHLFFLKIKKFRSNFNKNNLFKYLMKKKINAQFHYIPIYRFSIFKKNNYFKISGSEEFYKNTISLPIYYNLDKKKQEHIIKTLVKYANQKDKF